MLRLRYALSILVSLPIALVALLLAPLLAALADEAGNLPRWLTWFQTFDDDLDAGFRAGNTRFRWRYLNRVAWLVRNPAYSFDYTLFGIAWQPEEWIVDEFINTPALVLFRAHTEGGAFNYYYHGRYGMYKFGWKAWNLFDQSRGIFAGTWGPANRIPIVFSPNPFKQR